MTVVLTWEPVGLVEGGILGGREGDEEKRHVRLERFFSRLLEVVGADLINVSSEQETAFL